jgi:hypothetical protein
MLFPNRGKASLVGLVVAAGAVAAALLGPAGLAVGQSSPPTVGAGSAPIQAQIQVNSPATLVAKGAGVNVSVTASCSGQLVDSAQVSVGLTESVKGDIASGFGAASIDCTGASQTLTVEVVAELPGKAFKKGSAIATGSIDACTVNGSSCAYQTVTPTIKIKSS